MSPEAPVAVKRAETDSALTPAGFIDRFLAFVVDWNVVALPLGALAVAVDGHQSLTVALGLGVIAAFILYPALCWSHGGQTLGQWLLGLKVMRLSGDKLEELSLDSALARVPMLALSLLPLGLGVLWMKTNDWGRGWHDYAVGSCVVQLRPASRQRIWVTRGLFTLIAAGTLLVAIDSRSRRGIAEERSKVQATRDALLDLSDLERRFFARHGRYATTLDDLAGETSAPIRFADAVRASVEGPLSIEASDKAYRISARARDARKTLVVLDGPAD